MAQSFRTNLGNLAKLYIKQLKVPDTASTIKQRLQDYTVHCKLKKMFDKIAMIKICKCEKYLLNNITGLHLFTFDKIGFPKIFLARIAGFNA